MNASLEASANSEEDIPMMLPGKWTAGIASEAEEESRVTRLLRGQETAPGFLVRHSPTPAAPFLFSTNLFLQFLLLTSGFSFLE